MNLDLLRYFIALSSELNYRRAAQRAGIGQSPLSRAIARLEVGLDVVLFERSRQNVQLTAAGRALVPLARELVHDVSFAQRLAEVACNPATPVRLSFPLGGLGELGMRLVEEMQRRFPNTPVHLSEAAPELQIESLLDGTCDVAALFRPVELPEDVNSRIIDRRHLVAAIPSWWPAAEGGHLMLAELATLPLVLFSPATHPLCHSRLMDAFAAARLEPLVRQRAELDDTRLRLAAMGIGVTLLPAGTHQVPPGVVLRVITDLPVDVTSDVVLAWRKSGSAARGNSFQKLANTLF